MLWRLLPMITSIPDTITVNYCYFGSVIYGVHSRTMKIVMYTMVPRIRASPRHGGQGFFELFVTNPPRGRPFGGGGNHRK